MASKGKAKVKTESQKSEDFKRLAEKHANAAVRSILRLGKLANPAKFHYTPHQLDTISKAINQATEQTAARFAGKATADVIKL